MCKNRTSSRQSLQKSLTCDNTGEEKSLSRSPLIFAWITASSCLLFWSRVWRADLKQNASQSGCLLRGQPDQGFITYPGWKLDRGSVPPFWSSAPPSALEKTMLLKDQILTMQIQPLSKNMRHLLAMVKDAVLSLWRSCSMFLSWLYRLVTFKTEKHRNNQSNIIHKWFLSSKHRHHVSFFYLLKLAFISFVFCSCWT